MFSALFDFIGSLLTVLGNGLVSWD